MPDDQRPTPDPTVLTTEQLLREIEGVKTLLSIRIDCAEELRADAIKDLHILLDSRFEKVSERLAGIDRATELRLQGITDIPLQIDEKVRHLALVTDERFRSIAIQFAERDTRSERESRDNKLAVDAAFAAQEKQAAAQNKSNAEAIGKSELGTSETINKLGELVKSTTDALAAQIADIKDRVGRMESIRVGGQQAYAGLYAFAGFIAVAVAVVVALGFRK